MTQVAKHTTHGFLSGFFLAAQAALGQAQTAHADTSASLSPRLIPADVRRGSGHEGSGEDYEFTIGNLSARLLTIGIQLPPPPTMTKNRADLFCGFSALAGSRYCGQTRNAGIVLADNNLDKTIKVQLYAKGNPLPSFDMNFPATMTDAEMRAMADTLYNNMESAARMLASPAAAPAAAAGRSASLQ